MKKTAKIHQEREEKSRGVWDCGSPLYDSYELVSLSRIIERHLMKVPSLGRSKRVAAAAISTATSAATNQASQPRSGGNSNRPSNATSMEELVGKKKKEKAKTLKKKFCVIFSKIGLFKKEANPNEII